MAVDDSEAVEPLLVSDAERNAAVERLNVAFADGRLTHEEYSERLDQIYAARTDTELAFCFRGLPRPPRRPTPKPTLRRRTERLVEASSPALVCTAVWAMTSGVHGYFWPMWVWLPTGMSVIGGYLGSSGKRRRRQEREAWLATEGYLNPEARDRGLGQLSPPIGHPVGAPAGGSAPTAAPDPETRSVLSVVFVDIVGSTQMAASMGDRRWRARLNEFVELTDSLLAAHRGTTVFTRGDEVVATFASPAQAIAYAVAVREQVASLDMRVRAGIHTGEIEGREGDLSGITLHIGQRVSNAAAADQILVSSTVRDIAYGLGFEFVDHGEHELRGLDGLWHLYSVGAV